MQIQKINSVRYATKAGFGANKQNYLKNSDAKLSNPVNFTATMKDVKKYTIDWGYQHFCLPTVAEFDVYYPKQRKLNILNGTEDHLKDVAESLCMYEDEDIKNFTKVYYPLHLDENVKKSESAFFKILPHILNQREKLLNLFDMKEKLEDKKQRKGLSQDESNGLQYIIEEIERIDKKCKNAKWDYLSSQHHEVSEGTEYWENID